MMIIHNPINDHWRNKHLSSSHQSAVPHNRPTTGKASWSCHNTTARVGVQWSLRSADRDRANIPHFIVSKSKIGNALRKEHKIESLAVGWRLGKGIAWDYTGIMAIISLGSRLIAPILIGTSLATMLRAAVWFQLFQCPCGWLATAGSVHDAGAGDDSVCMRFHRLQQERRVHGERSVCH